MRKRKETDNINNKRLLSIPEAGAYCGLGRSKITEFAQEAGAVRRIGRRVLVDRAALDAAIDRLGIA